MKSLYHFTQKDAPEPGDYRVTDKMGGAYLGTVGRRYGRTGANEGWCATAPNRQDGSVGYQTREGAADWLRLYAKAVR